MMVNMPQLFDTSCRTQIQNAYPYPYLKKKQQQKNLGDLGELQTSLLDALQFCVKCLDKSQLFVLNLLHYGPVVFVTL